MNSLRFANLRGKRVLVTGASGFLANAAIRKFHELGAEVIALTSGNSGREISVPEGVEIVRGDIGEDSLLDVPISSSTLFDLLGCVDLIVNTHARVGDSGSRKEFEHANVHAVINLLDVLAHFSRVHLLHVSTIGALTLSHQPLIESTQLTRSGDLYCSTKRRAQESIRGYTQSDIPRRHAIGSRTVTVMPDVLYGITKSGVGCPHYPHRLRDILASRLPLSLPRRGEAVVGLTHVENAADALVVLSDKLLGGEVGGKEFILSDQNKVTWAQWIQRWGDIFDIQKSVGNIPRSVFRFLGAINEFLNKVSGGHIPLLMSRLGADLFGYGANCDSSKLRALGWEPAISYEDGMARVAESFADQKKPQ